MLLPLTDPLYFFMSLLLLLLLLIPLYLIATDLFSVPKKYDKLRKEKKRKEKKMEWEGGRESGGAGGKERGKEGREPREGGGKERGRKGGRGREGGREGGRKIDRQTRPRPLPIYRGV